MKKILLLLCVIGLAAPVWTAPRQASAQDEFEDDEGRRSRRDRGGRTRTAREIHHGFYVKAQYGTLGWFGNLGANSSFGTCAAFEVGYDVLDQLAMTLSITGTFYQGINNGITNAPEERGSGITQGDFRSIGGLAGARIGFNPGKRKVRRWTLAVDIKGGVYISPALRDQNDLAYGALQQSPGGLILPGFGVEHFTRLSHFSLGLDMHVPLIVGTGASFAAGLDVTGFFKYTF